MSINNSSQFDLNLNNAEFYTAYTTYNSDTVSDINFVADSTYKAVNTEDFDKSEEVDSFDTYEITCACCGRKVIVDSVKQDLCTSCMEELADSLAFDND